jgi:hypothetical protein
MILTDGLAETSMVFGSSMKTGQIEVETICDRKRLLQPGGVKMCGHRCIAGRRLKRSCSELNRNEDFAYAF